jgi:exopolysaccharide biosynthesis polyprenyl glycosylphosphotransferase
MHTERLSAPRAPSLAAMRTMTVSTAPRLVVPDEQDQHGLGQLQDGFREAPFEVDEQSPLPRRRIPLKALLVVVDVFAAALGVAMALVVFGFLSSTPIRLVIPVALLSLLVWPVAFAQQGLYHARHLDRRTEEMRRLVNAVFVGTVSTAAVSVLIQTEMSRGWMLLVAIFVLCTVSIDREIVRQVVRRRRRDGLMARRVVLVGNNSEADELDVMIQSTTELGYEVVGRVTDHPDAYLISEDGTRAEDETGPVYLGGTDQVLEAVRSTGASGVIVATTDIDLETANRLVRDLTREGVYVELSSSMRDIATRRVTVRPLGRYPVLSVEPVARTGWRAVFKRGFDVIAATLALIVFSPVLLAAAIAIRIDSGPGVLFSQTRVGRSGQPFRLFKLRTMVSNAEDMLPELMDQNEAAGPMFKMAKDPRVTRVGSFLRKTSIDELPQLFNVITGDMSLVGPRPAMPHEALQWNDDLRERLRVQPGITGNWQVNGRFTASMEDYQRLDLYYVDNWSVVTDLVILLKTVPAVLRRDGAA